MASPSSPPDRSKPESTNLPLPNAHPRVLSANVTSSTDDAPPMAAAGPPPRPAAAGSEPVMGYPRVMGYPPRFGTLSMYDGFSRDPPLQRSERFSGSIFARGALTGLFLFFILLCATSFITYMVLRPRVPMFMVTALSVSGFNVSDSVLMASWAANVTVDNPNSRLSVQFERVQCFVYYKDPGSYLAWTNGKAFALDTEGRGMIDVKMTMVGSEQPEKMVVEEMGRKRSAGTVSFGLAWRLVGTFKYGSWWRRHVGMRFNCVDLEVRFVGSTGDGFLVASDRPRRCQIF